MTGPSSERTADADVATIREVLLIEKGLAVTSSFHDPALAALDRLVARNQQLQEALAVLTNALSEISGELDTDSGDEWIEGLADQARAALASVRARTPQ